MTFEAAILELTPRGVRARIGGAEMWLPRSGPGIEWTGDVEVGGMAYLRAPKWLIAKHRPLAELQFQYAFALSTLVEGSIHRRAADRFRAPATR